MCSTWEEAGSAEEISPSTIANSSHRPQLPQRQPQQNLAAQLRDRARDIGVVVASSDPSEIVQVADRVVVVAGGDVAGELSVSDVTTHELSRLMAVERTAAPTEQPAGSTL